MEIQAALLGLVDEEILVKIRYLVIREMLGHGG
jgi:hypothetical protein